MYKKNPTILLSFYLIISILILSFNVNPSIKAARDFLFYVIISPYSKIDSVIFSVNRFGNNIKELVDAHQQILDLKNENKQLLTDLLKLKILEVEEEDILKVDADKLVSHTKLDRHQEYVVRRIVVALKSTDMLYRTMLHHLNYFAAVYKIAGEAI